MAEGANSQTYRPGPKRYYSQLNKVLKLPPEGGAFLAHSRSYLGERP
jgi:hypothetical protein